MSEQDLEFTSMHQKVKINKTFIENEIKTIEQTLRQKEDLYERLEEFCEIFDGLQASWRQEDPGKSEVYYTLMASDTQIQEKDGEIIKIKGQGAILKKWTKGEIPREVLVDSFEQAKQITCPNCQQEHPLIRRYYQSFDSPELDWWVMQFLVVCPRALTQKGIEEVTLFTDGSKMRML